MNDEKNTKKKPVSIDGIIQNSASSFDFKKSSSYKPSQSQAAIGDFIPAVRPTQRTSHEDFIAPPKTKRPTYSKKSRLFKWKKRSKNNQNVLDPYEKKKAKRRKKLKIVGVIVLILFLIFGYLGAKGYLNLRKVLSGGGAAAALNDSVDPSKLRVEGDGRINILLLGRGGEGHEGPDLTDTLILASIDPISKEAGLVSIPRDLYVKVPGKGSMKINSVFYTGKTAALKKSKTKKPDIDKAESEGLDLIQATVADVLGIPVHYRGMIDFAGFKEAIDTIGGVDVHVTEAVRERMYIDGRNYTLDVKPGQRHMGGFEALAYSRSRHTSKRGDFDRAERQRVIIAAMKNKILSAGTYSNPSKISQLLDNFGSHIQSNFGLKDLTSLYDITKEIDNSKIMSIGLADPPNNYLKTATISGVSAVVPTAGVYNYESLHSYIRNTLKDSFIKKENANIVILNGTSKAGSAKKKETELKSFGYKILKTDTAPTQNYTKTTLIDLKRGDKKYTKHYLEKRLKVLSSGKLPDGILPPDTADFVIIVGGDR